MIRRGFVKEKKGDQLRVCFERPEACEGCKGCAKGLLPKKELLTVFGQAQVGDEVDVQMPEARTLKASAMAYLLPLALLLAGLLAGSLCGLSDALTLLLALAGLALGGAGAYALDLKLRKKPQWRPSVVSVYPAERKAAEQKD